MAIAVLDRLLRGFTCDFAVDLGTANTLVHVRGQGVVVNEPTVVAFEGSGSGRRVIAVGNEARAMLGKTPDNIVATRPLRDGVIADYELTRMLLESFIKIALGGLYRRRGRVLLSVPAQLSSIDMRAVRDAAAGAGASQVLVIEQPMAAAVGAGLSMHGRQGSMIVDIGGGTTDVAVVAHGGRVLSHSLRVSGCSFDEAIVQLVRRKYNVIIGLRSAERIKMSLGSATPLESTATLDVNGQNATTGVPLRISVNSDDVFECFQGPLRKLATGVRNTFERVPPELSADIHTGGMLLCGGGALLPGVAAFVADACGVPVSVVENPLNTVIDGIATVMNDLRTYRQLVLA